MKEFKYDIYRYCGRYSETIKERLFRPNGLKYILILRKINNTKSLLIRIFLRLRLNKLQKKTFIQIPYNTKIGRGLYIGHYGSIVINPNTVIGENCNIAQGVTIGQENRGLRKGAPVIGNEVWIGANAVIVGKIKIGNDVLIAPNSYVNFDIPSHSIVIGNPGKIIHKENATLDYINKKVIVDETTN